MKKKIEIDSKEGKADLVNFFQEKFPDLTKKEIKDQIDESLNDSGRYSSYGPCYSVTVDGEEFNLIPDFDTFHDIAIDYVTEQLENEPELFNQDWLQGYTYITDTDKRLLAGEEAEAYTGDMSDRDITNEFKRNNDELIYINDDEEGELDFDTMREEIYDSRYDYVYSRLDRDPMDYFVNELGAYTEEEYLKTSFVNINVEEAAADAVHEDGEAHFLSHYDGNYEETSGGIIVMKE